MSLPQTIWISDTGGFSNAAMPVDQGWTEYSRAELSQASVAAALEAAVVRIGKERRDCKANPAFKGEWAQNYDDGLADAAIVTQALITPAQRTALQAAIDAAKAEARVLKPLIWENSINGRWIGTPPAKLGDLAFWVFQSESGYYRFVTGQGRISYATLELAKAAAQADYETRILSALAQIGAKP